MKYKVSATFIASKTAEFFEKLTTGEIENQQPDGREIIASMKRAIIKADGNIEWFEECYCSTPLKHERETVYDFYFKNMKVKEVDTIEEVSGDYFWDLIS